VRVSELGTEARRFLRAQQNAVLSTVSQRLAGFPFGSVTPYISDHAGQPLILISTLAEHTRNLQADPRVSLIVQPFSDSMQETARVTLLGRAIRVDDKPGHRSRYLNRFPQAETYFAMHDFNFYRIEPVRVRYIGGFGKIHWIEPEGYLCERGNLADIEADLLGHMNADHADALQRISAHTLGKDVPACMIGIDPDGFDLRLDNHVHRVEFDTPVLDAQTARQQLIRLAQEAITP